VSAGSCSADAVTAAAYVATIDHPNRFPRARQVAGYPGLVPRERSSGKQQLRGPITKAGDTRVRWLLVEAAWTILRTRTPATEPLRAWAERIARRRGKPIAVVALARRLARLLYAMWRDGTDYPPAHVGAFGRRVVLNGAECEQGLSVGRAEAR
jgi:transposase